MEILGYFVGTFRRSVGNFTAECAEVLDNFDKCWTILEKFVSEGHQKWFLGTFPQNLKKYRVRRTKY